MEEITITPDINNNDKLQLVLKGEDIYDTKVSLRELFKLLNVHKKYTDWFRRISEKSGLIEGENLFLKQENWGSSPDGGELGVERARNDHYVTLDQAIIICAMHDTEIARQTREHLKAVLKSWDTPEILMARTFHLLKTRNEKIEAEVAAVNEHIRDLRNKLIAAEEKSNELSETIEVLTEEKEDLAVKLDKSLEWITVLKYNELHNMGWNDVQKQKVGKLMTQFCKRNGFEKRMVPTIDRYVEGVGSYHMTSWDAFMKTFGESLDLILCSKSAS